MTSKKRAEHTLADILRIRPKWFLEKFPKNITSTLNYIHQLTEYGFSDILSQRYLDIFHTWTGIDCERRDINCMMVERREFLANFREQAVSKNVSTFEFLKHQKRKDISERIKTDIEMLKRSIRDRETARDDLNKAKRDLYHEASEIYKKIVCREARIQEIIREINVMKHSLSTPDSGIDPDIKHFLRSMHKDYSVAFIDSSRNAYLIRKHRLELKYVGNTTSGMSRTMISGYPIVIYNIPSQMIACAWMACGDPMPEIEGSATHPHLAGSNICWGNMLTNVERFAGTRDGYKAIGLFDALMTTYCPDNPYVSFHDLCKNADHRGYRTNVNLDYVNSIENTEAKSAILKTLAGIVFSEIDAYSDNLEILGNISDRGLKEIITDLQTEVTAKVTYIMKELDIFMRDYDAGSSSEHIVPTRYVDYIAENFDMFEEMMSITAVTFALCSFSSNSHHHQGISRFVEIWRECKAETTGNNKFLYMPLITRYGNREHFITKYSDLYEGVSSCVHLKISTIDKLFRSAVDDDTYKDEMVIDTSNNTWGNTGINFRNLFTTYSKTGAQDEIEARQQRNMTALALLRSEIGDGTEAAVSIDLLLAPFERDISQIVRFAITGCIGPVSDQHPANVIYQMKISRTKYGIVYESLEIYDKYSSARFHRTSHRFNHKTGGIMNRLRETDYIDRVYNIMRHDPLTMHAIYVAFAIYMELRDSDFGTTESSTRGDFMHVMGTTESSIRNAIMAQSRQEAFIQIVRASHEDIVENLSKNGGLKNHVEALLESRNIAEGIEIAPTLEPSEDNILEDVGDEYDDDDHEDEDE